MNTGFEGVDRILIRGVNWVGDTILTYPAVQRLKAGLSTVPFSRPCSREPGRSLEDLSVRG